MKVEYLLQLHNAIKAGPHLDLRIKHPRRNTLYSFVIKIKTIPVCSTKNKYKKPVFIIRSYNHSTDMLDDEREILKIPKGHYGAGTLVTIEKGTVEVLKWEKGYIELNFKSSRIFKGRYKMKRIYSSIFSNERGHFREIWLVKCA